MLILKRADGRTIEGPYFYSQNSNILGTQLSDTMERIS
jgi:hypothetical protein